MTPELPHWHPYNPGEPPPEIDFGEDSSLVVLLATAGASANRWAERAAVALAESWARKGERVFLADLGLSNPCLHEVLGAPNGEGMSDAFLYGASLRRIARPLPEGFFFASAGTPVADGTQVLTSSRWGVLAHGFARAGAHLVVFLPSEEAGKDAVLARAQRVLVLASPGEPGALSQVGDAAGRVAAVLWPSVPHARPGAPAPGPKPVGATPPVRTPLAPAAPAKPEVKVAPPAEPEPASSKKLLLVLGVLLLVVLVLAGLVTMGVVELPGLGSSPAPSAQGSPTAAAPAASASGGFEPGAPMAAYSLTLGSYGQAAVARLQAEALGAQRDDILFVVAPVEVNGEVLHRLLAGVAADPGAVELRQSLSATLTEEDPASWVVRATPLAFLLGSYLSLAEARTRALELQAVEVPAYVLTTAGADGRARYDVWAGAYANEREASYMRRVLGVDEVAAPLMERKGELPR